MKTVVIIYSLRTDLWTAIHDQLQGIYLVNLYGKFVDEKIYWIASTSLHDQNVCNIISFDVENETWGSLELPILWRSRF